MDSRPTAKKDGFPPLKTTLFKRAEFALRSLSMLARRLAGALVRKEALVQEVRVKEERLDEIRVSEQSTAAEVSCCKALATAWQSELLEWQDRLACCVCMARPANHVFVPCGHSFCCRSRADGCGSDEGVTCHTCGSEVVLKMRVLGSVWDELPAVTDKLEAIGDTCSPAVARKKRRQSGPHPSRAEGSTAAAVGRNAASRVPQPPCGYDAAANVGLGGKDALTPAAHTVRSSFGSKVLRDAVQEQQKCQEAHFSELVEAVCRQAETLTQIGEQIIEQVGLAPVSDCKSRGKSRQNQLSADNLQRTCVVQPVKRRDTSARQNSLHNADSDHVDFSMVERSQNFGNGPSDHRHDYQEEVNRTFGDVQSAGREEGAREIGEKRKRLTEGQMEARLQAVVCMRVSFGVLVPVMSRMCMSLPMHTCPIRTGGRVCGLG